LVCVPSTKSATAPQNAVCNRHKNFRVIPMSSPYDIPAIFKQSGLRLSQSWHMCLYFGYLVHSLRFGEKGVGQDLPEWEIKMTKSAILGDGTETQKSKYVKNVCLAIGASRFDCTFCMTSCCLTAWPAIFFQINWFRFDAFSIDCCRDMTRLWLGLKDFSWKRCPL
jgi:hypothetical protein